MQKKDNCMSCFSMLEKFFLIQTFDITVINHVNILKWEKIKNFCFNNRN